MDKDGYHGYDTDKKVVEYEALIRDLTDALRAQRTWVGLTDEERDAITSSVIGFNSCCGWEDDYAKAIEAKLKEKNT